MLDEIFNLESFNIIEDDNYYYFFRALNMEDNYDIENKITLDNNDNIIRIRTDRERYSLHPKYNKESSLSLEEIFDHVKMHHRKDTNCISLSSNANISIMYGRGNYRDKYAVVKVSKQEFKSNETNVVNAGIYMLKEIQKRIEYLLNNNEISEIIKYFLALIENSQTQKGLDDAIKTIKTFFADNSFNNDFFEGGIEFENRYTTSLDYLALNDKQNFEKNKIIAKLDLLKTEIIPNVSNKFLIQTLGNAFSSLEFIHYDDIQKENIISIPKEFIDIFSLLQQLPRELSIINDLKQEILIYINNNINKLDKFEYDSYKLDTDLDYTIEKMYELTNGTINFYDAIELYKKSFYLSKSKLRTINIVASLRKITNNNPKYNQVFDYMLKNTYGIEPEIFSRMTSNKHQVSETVSLDFTNNNQELFNFINSLNHRDLIYIINNPLEALKYYFTNFKSIEHYSLDKETYYANAIIDIFDWSKLEIVKFSFKQRNDIINKLKEYDIVNIYNSLKIRGIKEKDISNILLTTIIKGNDLNDFSINETFTVEELEDFLGYYKVKDTKKLKLRSYQATAIKNIDKSFKTHQFTTAVLPTGAGKSFVALAEMLKYQDKEILYLAPNDEILNQIENNIVEYIHGNTLKKTKRQIVEEVFPNLKLKTYSSLLSFNQKEIIDHTYDLIVFDELHRSGANDWNKHILELLKNQTKETKVLGITATPLRDVDGKNMAVEWARYFGYLEEEIQRHEHLSMNMDLEEAIKLGYVVNPKVVQCEYTLKEKNGFLDNLLEKINSLDDDEKKQQFIEKFDKLRKVVNEADGIAKIIGDNIKKGGKYIVFCPVGKNNEDLLESDTVIQKYQQELINYLKEYYQVLDEELFSMFEFSSMLGKYSKSINRRNLEKFETHTSDKIKFMLVINKLNEGVHVNNIDGLIWFRALDDNSKILYLQQLGRIISATDPNKSLADEKRPIAIDLVNNILRVNLNTKKTWTDELDKLKLIIDWIQEHNGRIPDLNSDDKVERNYGFSLKKIQDKYLEYTIYPEKIKELTEADKQKVLQIIALGKDIDLWNFDFPEQIKKLANNKKDVDINYDLFELTGVLKDFYDLSQEVDVIDNSRWNIMYNYAKKYYEHNGNLEVPFKFKTDNGYEYAENGKIKLGTWIMHRRQETDPTSEKGQLLAQIGMRFENIKNIVSFEEMYNYAKKYYEHHRNLEVPRSFNTNNGYEYAENGEIKLGQWIFRQRLNTNPTSERGQLLIQIGMRFENIRNNVSFEEMYEYAKKYYEHHGNLEVPQRFKTNNGYEYAENGRIKLGTWIRNRRKDTDPTSERGELLTQIGMRFGNINNNVSFEEMYNYAKKYYEHNGNLEVPFKFKTNNGYEYAENGRIKLGTWIMNRRKDIDPTSERGELLTQIGMRFENINNNVSFEEMYNYAKKYYEYHGNLEVPRSFNTNNGYEYAENGRIKLGTWIMHRRKDTDPTSERGQLLAQIGMIWSTRKNKDEVKDLCDEYGIDYKKEKSILKKSYLELYTKINFLKANNIPIVLEGKLHEIFFMADLNMQAKYQVTIASLIETYGKEKRI